MATYKTPGVYVEEISKFPPSVAQVETAIPAFIGYTEKAEKRNGDSLSMKPTRIKSLLEYETYFGRADNENGIGVVITDVISDGNTVRSIKVSQPEEKSPYLMYYSLQIYFANGGGPCYITSVGSYNDTVVLGTSTTGLSGGLAVIRKEDEPTLLLFPDATSLGTVGDFYEIYKQALDQCNSLQDRFTIMDTYKGVDAEEMSNDIEALRNGVGSNYLKYGAAYYPFIETILDYQYDESKLNLKHFAATADAYDQIKANINLIKNPASGLPKYVDELYTISPVPPLLGPYAVGGYISDTLFHMYDVFDMSTYATIPPTAQEKLDFINLMDSLLLSMATLIEWKHKLVVEANAAASTIDEDPVIQGNINTALGIFTAHFEGTDKIEEVRDNLVALLVKYQNAGSALKEKNVLNVNSSNIDAELKKLFNYVDLDVQAGVTAISADLFGGIVDDMDDLVTLIESIDGLDMNNGSMNGRPLASIEADQNTAYNQIKNEIAALPITLPPSAAMAGVYARTDANVGVWKAPANTSLNYVIKPSVLVSGEDQADMNVTTTGKSVNAIRSFIGKGTLVWGARTLAGNDNEWRYIPVRRFFNMVEESVNKASEQFVFESNDANTWVKMQAMIENFLNLQWKAGALAGSKPEQAYYVRVGLGSTMTAQDILEGRMIIEIGMAAVRPAEFIILRFSHKMQEA